MPDYERYAVLQGLYICSFLPESIHRLSGGEYCPRRYHGCARPAAPHVEVVLPACGAAGIFTSPGEYPTPMDGFVHPYGDGHHMFEGWPGFPFLGWGMLLLWLLVFLVIGVLVYRDANRRGMNGLLWFILVILPMVRFIFLILFLVLREPGGGQQTVPVGDTAMDVLRQRYARGDIDEEEFRKREKELERRG